MVSSGMVTYNEYRVCIKMNLGIELFSINICKLSGKAKKRVRDNCSFSLGRARRPKYGISFGNAATDVSLTNL
jgi:hypothetical protein